MPAIRLMMVLLPLPDGPVIATISPAAMAGPRRSARGTSRAGRTGPHGLLGCRRAAGEVLRLRLWW